MPVGYYEDDDIDRGLRPGDMSNRAKLPECATCAWFEPIYDRDEMDDLETGKTVRVMDYTSTGKCMVAPPRAFQGQPADNELRGYPVVSAWGRCAQHQPLPEDAPDVVISFTWLPQQPETQAAEGQGIPIE